MRFCLLLCFSLLITLATSQSRDPYNSLLWEVSGNGLSKPSYLYGTMHVSHKVAFHLADSFYIALQKCDMVGLESNPEIYMHQLFTNRELRSDFDDSNTQDPIYYDPPQHFFESGFNYHSPDPLLLQDILQIEPLHFNTLLFRSYNLQDSDFEEDTWLDMFIYQAGKKLGKTIVGMEDFLTVLEMSKKAEDLSEEDRKAYYKKRESFDEANETLYEKLEDAYRKADLPMLDSLSKLSHSDKYLRIMIDERNLIMAQSMDSLMHTGSLFAAMGAAHLPGKSGVISLLQEKGYVLRPVFPFKKKAARYKEHIESLSYPLRFQRVTAPDSSFTAMLPGAIYTGNTYGPVTEYLCPDLANGAFFAVYHMPMPPSFSKKGQSLASLDSLLFELIPGKIRHTESVLHASLYPARDLVAINRRGHAERYRFIETPDQLYLLKVSGTGTFATKNALDKFFQSLIPALLPKQDSRMISLPENGYAFQLPGKLSPVVVPQWGQGALREFSATDLQGHTYVFMHRFYSDFDYIEEDSFELAYIARHFCDDNQYQIDTAFHLISQQLPACYTRAHHPDGMVLHLYTTLRGPDYFLMALFGDAPSLPYFESLRFDRPFFAENIDYQEDTIYNYRVMSFIPPVPKRDDQGNAPPETTATPPAGSSGKALEENVNRERFFLCPTTNEIIRLDSWFDERYATLPAMNERWENDLSALRTHSGMTLIRENTYEEGPFRIADWLLADTNSTRAIRIKHIHAGRNLLRLSVNIDTVRGASEWVETFFATFKPIRYVEPDIQPLFDTLCADLFSADSTVRDRAYLQLLRLPITTDQAAQLLRITGEMHAPYYHMIDKAVLLEHILSSSPHSDLLPWVESLYIDLKDTSECQYELLNWVFSQKNKESYQTGLRMLEADLPVFRNDHLMANLYERLMDSVDLVIPILPGLMRLSSHPEYIDFSFRIAARLLHLRKLDPAILLPHKQHIFQMLEFELKKEMARRQFYSYEDYDWNVMLMEDDGEMAKGMPARYVNQQDSMTAAYALVRSFQYQANPLFLWTDLALPFRQDTAFKKLLEKSDDLFPSGIHLLNSIAALHHGHPVPDSVWNYYARLEQSRAITWHLLQFIDATSRFDTTFLRHESMASAYLTNQFYEQYDSITWFRTDTFDINHKTFVMYFYTVWKDSETGISWAGYPAKDRSAHFTPTMTGVKNGYLFHEKTDANQMVDKIKTELALKHRKRIQPVLYSY